MYVIQLTVSIGYGDYLRHTLPYNCKLVDAAYVVTTTRDAETFNAILNSDAGGILGENMNLHGADFNKGALINDGIRGLLDEWGDDYWILHLDADILLPPDFKEFCSKYVFDKDSLYGCPRMICPSSAAWKAMKASGGWGNPAWERQNKGLETRHKAGKAGYFQMWNAGAACLGGVEGMPWYPENSPHAGKSDSLFMRKFPEDKRHELPIEVIELHQNYQKTDPMNGPNWRGRTTPRFEGE